MQNKKINKWAIEFGRMMNKKVEDNEIQTQVKKLQEYISENFYHCTLDILLGLGNMYAGGGDFPENIDSRRKRLCGVYGGSNKCILQ